MEHLPDMYTRVCLELMSERKGPQGYVQPFHVSVILYLFPEAYWLLVHMR